MFYEFIGSAILFFYIMETDYISEYFPLAVGIATLTYMFNYYLVLRIMFKKKGAGIGSPARR